MDYTTSNPLNGAIITNYTIPKCVITSAAKAELGALFLNALEAKIMRLTLEEIGHPQSPTPIHCENSTRRWASARTPSNDNGHEQCIWHIFGYCAIRHTNCSELVTTPGKRTSGITRQSIILAHTTDECGHFTSTPISLLGYYPELLDQVKGEGVLE